MFQDGNEFFSDSKVYLIPICCNMISRCDFIVNGVS